jgi:hypothetical protein
MEGIMEGAYDRWQANNWSQQEFWDQLDAAERFTVFIGNMNYQVENGGFIQWWDNYYATEENVRYILRACDRIGTEASQNVSFILSKVLQILSPYDPRHPSMDEETFEEIYEHLSALDTIYYQIHERFLRDCEVYLNQTWPDRSVGPEVQSSPTI